MEFFVIILYSFKSLTTFIKQPVLDVFWGGLDPSLITPGLLMTSINYSSVYTLLKYNLISLENG